MIKMIKNLPPISQLLIFDKILERETRARHEIWQFTISNYIVRFLPVGALRGWGGGRGARRGRLACTLEKGKAQREKVARPLFFQVVHGFEIQQ